MSVLILTQAEVERLLPMADCIDLMAATLAGLTRGEYVQPLRMIVFPPGASGGLGLMPAYHHGAPTGVGFGVKAVCVYPGNPARGKDAHQGSVLVFSGETGELLALMNASAITAIRTAAVSAVATRLLARPEAGHLALVGAGVQAESHLAALACVRPIRRVRVAARRPESARRFAAAHADRYPFPIEAVESVEAAVRGAEIICTVTSSAEPVLRREWIAPGAHLNVVGSSVARAREVDTATMAAASLFVDRRESMLNEAGDYLFAAREGAIGPDHIRAELGEILIGRHPGRTAPTEITLFKSLGLAVEDLAAAEYLYQRASSEPAGTWVEF